MAKFCIKCNSKLGILEMMNDTCGKCKAEAAAEREEKNNQRIIEKVRNNISNGNKLFFYKEVFIRVDSNLLDKKIGNVDMSLLRRLGIEGWELTGIVHRTNTIALINKTEGVRGSHYGGSAAEIGRAHV